MYGLLNDAVGSANYIVLNHRINGQILIGNGRKLSWPSFRYFLGMFLERVRNTMKILSLHSHSPGHVEVLHCTVIWTVVQYRHKTVQRWILWKFSEILKNIWNGRCLAVAYRTVINVESFVCSGLLLLCLSTEQAFISNKLKFVNIHLISHVVDDFHSLPIILKYIVYCKTVCNIFTVFPV